MIDKRAAKQAIYQLIHAIGEDPTRPGLEDTPDRVAAFWSEFIDYDPGNLTTSFASSESSQLVVVSGIRVWSLCEHHLLPFWCDVSIGYIPDGKVLGLSKFARVAQQAAHRLQIQERMTTEIADEIEHLSGVASVAVLARGEHTCMQMRGAKSSGEMCTSVMRGDFRDIAVIRSEFLALVSYGRKA